MNGIGDSPIGPFVNLNDENADAYIVRDIGKTVESGTWRWAGAHPEIRFYLNSNAGWKLKLDFAIAQTTFDQTGPVTLSVSVNNRLFDKIVCQTPGTQRFEKSVLSSMLIPHSVNTLSMELDKTWVSPVDGAKLGFILTRAGFVQ